MELNLEILEAGNVTHSYVVRHSHSEVVRFSGNQYKKLFVDLLKTIKQFKC